MTRRGRARVLSAPGEVEIAYFSMRGREDISDDTADVYLIQIVKARPLGPSVWVTIAELRDRDAAILYARRESRRAGRSVLIAGVPASKGSHSHVADRRKRGQR